MRALGVIPEVIALLGYWTLKPPEYAFAVNSGLDVLPGVAERTERILVLYHGVLGIAWTEKVLGPELWFGLDAT